jgi:trehalose 6-phosphate phosphatase
LIALPEHAALLLDLDGTLIDIAPTPNSVVVADGLADTLLRLRANLGDALAVVTGRPIADVDRLLPGVPFAVAGEHGGVIRHAPSETAERAMIEVKARGFVLHYRLAPDCGPWLRKRLDALMAGWTDHVVGAAHMAWEIKPAGIDKGRAVEALMARAPFAGRVPVFVGDDVTDEDGMRVARAMGGVGLRVQDYFGDAAGVRAWLAGIA